MSHDSASEVLVVRLDPQSLDDLAHRVADLVHQQQGAPAPKAETEGRLLSAAQVAERWGVDRSWIYEHAEQLGVRRLGTGVKPRLRFDPALVAAYLEPTDDQPAPEVGRVRSGNVRRSPRMASDCAEALPFRPDLELSSTHRPRRPGGVPTPPATAPKPRTPAR
jgi:hypothetical protein